MPVFTNRLIYTGIFLCCFILMSIAFYFEYVVGLEPCPLCMAQRVVFVFIGLIALIGAMHRPALKGSIVYSLLIFLGAAGGAALAARQVWLQNLPEDLIPACGPGIYYMLDVFPLSEVLTNMLMGTGDCAEVVWRDPVLKLSIPSWTLIWFIGLGIIALLAIKAAKKP